LGWCRMLALDIILAQETNAQSTEETDQWSKEWSGASYWSSYPTHTEGLGILLSKTAATLPHQIIHSSPRIMILKITIAGMDIAFVNIYGPATRESAPKFYEDLLNLAWDPELHYILAGDFNLTLDPRDRPGQVNERGPAHILQTLVDQLDTEDIWRIRNPDATAVTRVSPDGTSGSRIDRIYTPVALRSLFKGPTHVPAAFSDHHSVIIELNDPTRNPSPYWKLNISLLQDPGHQGLMNKVIDEVLTNNADYLNPGDLWERLKEDLRSTSKAFAREKARLSRTKLTTLQDRLQELQHPFPLTKEALEETAKIRTELAESEVRRLAGAKIRSRARWIEVGEKPCRLFSSLEKTRKITTSIPSIRCQAGTPITSRPLIKKRIKEYYADLYQSRPCNPIAQKDLIDSITNKLSAQQQASCEGMLTLEELTAACKSAPRNKTPGPDGLPADFFQAFWPKLGPLLLRVANASFDLGHLPETLRTGYTTLIPKKGDLQDISNWRPISLLCADAKMITKAIYNRLAKVITSVIGPHQTAVPGRYIHHNTRLVQDVLDLTASQAQDGGILFLDQTKAFDRVEWELLDQTLSAMGFGNNFLRWTKTLRNMGANRVIVNGELTDAFPLTRGVRQGDPLSPLLYCVALEALASAINADTSISGFRLPGSPQMNVKLVIYADDTAVFFSNASDLAQVSHWVTVYELASGAEVNKKKSSGLVFSGDPSRFSTAFPTVWTPADTPTKYLGVLVGRKVNQDSQWKETTKKLASSLKLWSRRDLSLTGKRSVINTYALSKLWYIASFTPIPTAVATEVNKLVFDFLRGSRRRALVAQDWFSVPRDQGGLGLVDTRSQGEHLLRIWCRRLLNDTSDAPWTRIPWYCVFAESGVLDQFRATLLCRNPGKVYRSAPSPFWRTAIRLTRALPLSNATSLSPTEFLSLPLWDNPLISWNGKPLSSKTWDRLIARSKIRHVYHLVDANGKKRQARELAKLTDPGTNNRTLKLLQTLTEITDTLTPRLEHAEFTLPSLTHQTLFFRSNPNSNWIQWSQPKRAPLSPRYEIEPKRWEALLKRVHVRATGLKWNDLFLRILHRNLPLGHTRRHYDPGFAACPICRDPDETNEHVFWHCPAARATRETANSVLRKVNAPLLMDACWLEIIDPTYPKGPSQGQRRKRTSVLILHRATLYAIWLNRCSAAFDKASVDDAPGVLRGILSRHVEALGLSPSNYHTLLL